MKRLIATLFLAPLIMVSAMGQQVSEQRPTSPHSDRILTPKAPDTPRINGAKVYGNLPGTPFLYKIPCSGIRPMTFSAEGLPKGLKLDAQTGIITGSVKKSGTYNVTLHAENSLGCCSRELRIVIGEDALALTPPMGWNSWNCWADAVSQEKVISSANALLESGLAEYGWAYINMDDGWQGVRGGKWNGIQPNDKFPDMKAMCDYLHSKGLKVGIYSCPWIGTYAGHIGSECTNPDGIYEQVTDGYVNENYRVDGHKDGRKRSHYYRSGAYSFARQDALQWADWGIDYLKYDSWPNNLADTKEMAEALKNSGRSIILSLSNSIPFADVHEHMKYAQCARNARDIRDNWPNVSAIIMEQPRWTRYTAPGSWLDADMLVVGVVGWREAKRDSRLTADEQYTHVTLWSLLACPLLIGCDLARIDDFTFSLLSNNEVIDVNQDPLGIPASLYYFDSTSQTWVKPLEDGSLAIGMFNLSEEPKKMSFRPSRIGLSILEEVTVRDLWRQEDVAKIGRKEDFEVEVAPHGCAFYRLSPGNWRGKTTGDFVNDPPVPEYPRVYIK